MFQRAILLVAVVVLLLQVAAGQQPSLAGSQTTMAAQSQLSPQEPSSSPEAQSKAQAEPPVEHGKSTAAQGKPKGIQDNSFLVEEAYNQEFGVVQHISSVTRFAGNNWVYTFTQEWPVPGVKHQLSYTLTPRQNAGDGAGWGDTLINYRYQLLGNGDAKLAVAPRLSLILPSGDSRRALGGGSTGIQYLIPASIVLTKELVTHLNVGGTYLPNARNEGGDKAFTKGYNLGQSFIWLAHDRVNLMLESIFVANEDVVGPNRVRRTHDVFISPGIRWAYNFNNGLQIVPGVGAPQGVGSSSGQHGVIFYLSFEHPFRKIPK
jgi:hypothetical protein